MHFGYDDIASLNWGNVINSFQSDVMKNYNRNTTLFGKVSILNYIGFSKFWYRAVFSVMPSGRIKLKNGHQVDIKNKIDKLTQGFLWGFHYTESGMKLDLENPKIPLISKNTLYLKKEEGGADLINYQIKMQAFRILLVYKYLQNNDNNWTDILNYWFATNIFSISRQRWNNTFPHAQSLEEIPPFFKKCLIEFKDYYLRHGNGISEQIS